MENVGDKKGTKRKENNREENRKRKEITEKKIEKRKEKTEKKKSGMQKMKNFAKWAGLSAGPFRRRSRNASVRGDI